MDNYLKMSAKLFELRKFLEKSQGDQFERKIYLAFREMEDMVGIHQCMDCGRYDFVNKMELQKHDGTADFVCMFCQT